MKLSPLAHQTSAHADAVWSVAWCPTGDDDGGDLLLTGSVDESVKSWRATAEGLEMVHDYQGHTLGVVSLAVASNGLVASSALDSFVRVWDLKTHETRCVIECPAAENWAVAFEPTKDDAAPTLLALAGGVSGAVKLYSVADGDDLGACVATMPLPRATGGGDGGKGAAGGGSSRFAHSIAFSPDGRRVVCGAMDGTVAVFDVPSRKLLHTLEGHAMPVRGVCFSVDSKTAFTACDDGYVHAYDVETRSLTQSFPGHDAWALSVAASPCGRAVVSCGADGTVKLWDLTQGLGVGGKMAQSVSDVSDATWGACFKPGTAGGGGGRLAAVGDDASVCLYDFTA